MPTPMVLTVSAKTEPLKHSSLLFGSSAGRKQGAAQREHGRPTADDDAAGLRGVVADQLGDDNRATHCNAVRGGLSKFLFCFKDAFFARTFR